MNSTPPIQAYRQSAHITKNDFDSGEIRGKTKTCSNVVALHVNTRGREKMRGNVGSKASRAEHRNIAIDQASVAVYKSLMQRQPALVGNQKEAEFTAGFKAQFESKAITVAQVRQLEAWERNGFQGVDRRALFSLGEAPAENEFATHGPLRGEGKTDDSKAVVQHSAKPVPRPAVANDVPRPVPGGQPQAPSVGQVTVSASPSTAQAAAPIAGLRSAFAARYNRNNDSTLSTAFHALLSMLEKNKPHLLTEFQNVLLAAANPKDGQAPDDTALKAHRVHLALAMIRSGDAYTVAPQKAAEAAYKLHIGTLK